VLSSDFCIQFAHSAYQLEACYRASGAPQEELAQCFQTWTREETAARIGEAEVLVVSGFWDNGLLQGAEKLKFIQVCAAGYDQFDQAALKARGIKLANSSGVNMRAVSDHAMALLLSLTRKLHEARDNQAKQFWRPMISDISAREDELAGKRILIYGLGKIGQRLARLAKAFEMEVVGVRRSVVNLPEGVDRLIAPDKVLGELPSCDVAVLTCPLTSETRGVANAAFFSALPDSAYFINVARGGCADEAALVEALGSGRIAGAGIDTTVEEPLASSSPLWGMSNVILTPHTAGETQAYERNVIGFLAGNLGRLKDGVSPLVNEII